MSWARWLISVAVASGLVICIAPVRSVQAQAPVDTASLQAALDSMCVQMAVPGAAAALLLPGGREWTGACGIAAEGVPATPDHLFEIGSVTKTYTAALVLDLVVEGRIDLDGEVSALLPEVENLEGVTVRHLLQHTSGLYDFAQHPGYLGALQLQLGRAWKPLELLASFRGERVFEPGADWSYSSTNYHVLGLLVERLTDRPFHEALRERILQPQGLTATFVGGADSISLPAAHAFIDINGDGTLEDLTALAPNTAFLTAAWASGAIMATARDVARWMDRLGAGAVTNAEMYGAMLAGRERGDGMEHGLGVILWSRDGTELIGHKGNSAGFSASVWSAYRAGVTVAVLTNLHATDVTPIAVALLDRALEMQAVPSETP